MIGFNPGLGCLNFPCPKNWTRITTILWKQSLHEISPDKQKYSLFTRRRIERHFKWEWGECIAFGKLVLLSFQVTSISSDPNYVFPRFLPLHLIIIQLCPQLDGFLSFVCLKRGNTKSCNFAYTVLPKWVGYPTSLWPDYFGNLAF